MERILGREVEMSEVEGRIVDNFEAVFGYSSPEIFENGGDLSRIPEIASITQGTQV
jgi:hypothetical protein